MNTKAKKATAPVLVNATLTKSEQESVCARAVADLFERDIAELKRTKQPGGAAFILKLRSALKEIRRVKSTLP